MIKRKYFILLIIIFNLIGIGISLLYGKYGGSGSETTEGVFLGIKLTGIIVSLLIIVLSIIYKDWFIKNWFIVLPLLAWGILQIVFLEFVK